MFYGISEHETFFVQWTDVMFICKHVYNQKPSIISAHVLMIEASKLNTYVKEHK